MNIYPLKEGTYSIDEESLFFCTPESKMIEGSEITVQPFLIQAQKEIILLDAGLGQIEDGMPKIYKNIKSKGFSPNDVTKIFISHLHKDHIEGLVNKLQNQWILNFPKAILYIQKREYEYALSAEDTRFYDIETLEFIIENSNISWIDKNFGDLTSEISFEVTGGDTPFHQAFYITDNDRTIFYEADNMATIKSLKENGFFNIPFKNKNKFNFFDRWKKSYGRQFWDVLLYHDTEYSIVHL